MGIINTNTGEERKCSLDELKAAAKDMRALSIISIHAANSGHPGGSLSIMDITAALYLNEAKLSPAKPDWEKRDRIFFSAGHKAPALYAALATAGFVEADEVVTLRKLFSPFQGHPHARLVPGIEVSSGSLGQGLGIAVGSAIYGRVSGEDYRVFCIMGDGEQQEGSVWEAVMCAGHYALGNLCVVVDCNRLQIDGWVEDVMSVEPLSEKYRAFNWNVIEIDGHDMREIVYAFKEARDVKDKPTVILARTIKGKGVSFMENEASWHGKATKSNEELLKALQEIDAPNYGPSALDVLLLKAHDHQQKNDEILKKRLPKYSSDYWWRTSGKMNVRMVPTRFGFGVCLEQCGDDPRIVTIHADISDSIKISDFEHNHSQRKKRVFSVGIAEQNMMSVAAGLALEGKIPVAGTYSVFAAGRAWDQIRTTICYDNLNVKIAGAHGGISVGPDGATHQALEEITLMNVLPNMSLVVPCDALETERLSTISILDVKGPVYIRFAREATPVVTREDYPLEFGKANIIRFRREAENFIDAFETILASEYKNEKEDISLVSCGPMTAEAMRAAWILKAEHDIETRVVHMHTVKPLDVEAVIRAARDTNALITCEDHQTGGFGNTIAGAVCRHRLGQSSILFAMIGVDDRFGESGHPWELMVHFGLTAEYIAERAVSLLRAG